MTEAEKIDAELDAMIADGLAAAQEMQSPWEPRCVGLAFASESPRTFVLTMHAWIDLDVIRSPVLKGNAPETREEFYATLHAFGVEEKKGAELDPEEAAVMTDEMLVAVALGFSMALPMEPPGSQVEGEDEADGFGGWLPVFGCLVTQCGIDPDAAMKVRVDWAFALIATMRRNQGWKPKGTPYALREMGNSEKLKAEIGEEASR